ncbi:multidrug DMT transporter permease [Burkholderia sp. Leaf177]|uniref:DMT family transporter n=1 Tax=Burkholderia sp. Leaf177 TaxID=1736287 RepID=UPI0006FF1EA6|nr:DMT family transporter [Burkholderia sp. Leaf177]KQR76195.1 multidrug DMT transporter permease [Burkholderia sp. Leaf177]
MQPFIVLLVLFSALLHATWNAFLHTSEDRVWQFGMMSFPYIACSAVALLYVPAPARESWPYIAASAILQFGYCVALAKAYKAGDFGQIYPIARGLSPLLVFVGAFVFAGEHLRPLALAGVMLVSVGIISLAFRKRRFATASVPAALVTGAFISAYTIVDGIGVRVAGTSLAYIAWVYLLFNVPFAVFALYKYGGPRQLFLSDTRRSIQGMAGGAIAMIAYGIVVFAFRYLPIAMVSALRELSSIFAVLISWIFLNEKLTARRVVACALVTAGAVLIRI